MSDAPVTDEERGLWKMASPVVPIERLRGADEVNMALSSSVGLMEWKGVDFFGE